MNYPIKASLAAASLVAILAVAMLFAAQRLLLPEWSEGTLYRVVWGNFISPVILVLFFIAVFLLWGKRRKLRREQALSNRFFADIGPQLFDGNTRVEEVVADAAVFKDNLLAHRWAALQSSSKETTLAELGRHFSATESEHLNNSFTLARFFVWALPIVGFIGTVWGIGLSISFFSETMSSSQAGASVSSLLQQNIPLVTKGLSTAFDTTLLALILSVPATGLLVMTERNERDYLLSLDEQWQRFLIARNTNLDELATLDIEFESGDSHAMAVNESLRDMRESAFERFQQGGAPGGS